MKRPLEKPAISIEPDSTRPALEAPPRRLDSPRRRPVNVRCTNCPQNVSRRSGGGPTCCRNSPIPGYGSPKARGGQKGPKGSGQSLAFKGLIVDDDRGVREFMAAVLDKAGYSVVTAESGMEAVIQACSSEGLDFLIADYQLSPNDGLELAAVIRGIFPEIRVVLISGHGTAPSRAAGMIDAFVAKPFVGAQLCRTIQEVLDTRPIRTSHATNLHS